MIYLELKFSEEELSQIEALSGAGYSPEKIAMYLDVDKKKFLKEWKNKDTIVRYHYDRGLLLDSAAICVVFPPGAAAISRISAFSFGFNILAGNIDDKL